MKTGLKKRDKTTEIYFDEASPIVEIRTHNTDLKNRLTAYAGRFPDLCKQTDEDEEQGCKSFEIVKGRFSIRLTAECQHFSGQFTKPQLVDAVVAIV